MRLLPGSSYVPPGSCLILYLSVQDRSHAHGYCHTQHGSLEVEGKLKLQVVLYLWNVEELKNVG